MTYARLNLGKSGEDAAVDFVRSRGYRIVDRNYRTRLGEIDIVGWDKDTLCFIEVKTRAGDSGFLPWEAVDRRKRRQLSKAALVFLKEKKLFNKKARFDVVGVAGVDGVFEIDIIKNAFELDAAYSY